MLTICRLLEECDYSNILLREIEDPAKYSIAAPIVNPG
jgi:hypothetical protein